MEATFQEGLVEEQPVEDTFQEPLLVQPSTVPQEAADTISAQVGLINGNLDFTDTSFSEVEKAYQQAFDDISINGTNNIKESIAQKQVSEVMSVYEADALMAIQSGEASSPALQMAVDYSVDQANNLKEVALENAFTDKMLEYLAADPDNSHIVSDMMDFREKGAALDRIIEMNKRSMMLQRVISETLQSEEQGGLPAQVINTVMSFVPLREWYQLFKIEPDEGFMQGDMAKSLNNKFYEIPEEYLPAFLKDFSTKLKDSSALVGVNEAQMLDTLNVVLNVSDAQRVGQNVIGFVDAADVLTMVSPLVKGVATKALTLTRFGQRALAERSILDTLKASGETPTLLNEFRKEMASESVMPSGSRILEPLTEADVANTAGVVIRGNHERSTALVNSILRDERILDADRQESITNAIMNMADEYGSSTIADVDFPNQVGVTSNSRGITTVSLAIGNKNGGGIVSKEVAEAVKEIRKLPEDATVFQARDMKWYIKVDRDVTEAFILPQNVTMSPYNPLSKWAASPASELPKWVQARAENAGSLQGMYAKQMNPIIKTILALPKNDYKELGRVVLKGNIQGKFYDRATFDAEFSLLNANKLPSAEQWAGYKAFVNLNDIDLAFRRWERFVDLSAQGYQTTKGLKFENLATNRVNLKPLKPTDDLTSLSIYDQKSNTFVSGKAKGADYFKSLVDRGYEMFRLEGNHRLKDNSGVVNAIIVKKGEVRPGVLSHETVPYREGGHRGPEGSFFLKQAQVGFFAESGKAYLRNPLTHAVGRTRSALEDYANRMNEALSSFNNWSKLDDAAKAASYGSVDTIVRKAFDGGIDDIAERIEKGSIDKDHKFEIVENNENPAHNLKPDDIDADLRDLNSFSSFVETQGRPYYGRKGAEPLRGPDDEVAKLIDPMSLMSKSLSDSIHRGNLANYRNVAAKAWVETFSGALRDRSGMNPRGLFFSKKVLDEADFDPKANKAFVRAAINQHAHMQTQLSSHNEYGRFIAGAMTRLANFVDDKGGASFAGKLMDWRSSDPVMALRSLAYNVHLGLLQVDQLFVQTQTALNITAMDPLNAPKYLNRGLHFQALNFVTSDEALNLMAKNFKDPEDFKEFVRIGRERGVIDLFGEMAELDHNRLFNVGGPLSISNIAQKGRSLVMSAERYNKSVGYAKAWDELRATRTLKQMRDMDVQQELSSLTAKYSMNMTSMSAARWQKGIMGIPTGLPTQFLSYPIRFMENMTFSKQWSFGEKVRLGVSHGVLYGGSGIGILGGPDVFAPMLEAMGLDPEEDRAAFLAARGGIVDATLQNFLGVDGSLSNRVGLAKGLRDLWDRLNGNDLQQTSFLEAISGPAGELAVDFYNSAVPIAMEAPAIMMEAVRAERAGLFVDHIEDQLENFAVQTLAGVNDGFKAYWAYKTGNYISSRSGRVLLEGLTNSDALGFLIGSTPTKMLDTIRRLDDLKDDKALVSSAAEVVSRLRNEEVRHFRQYNETGDTDAYEAMLKSFTHKNLLLGAIDDEKLKAAIIKKADSKAFTSFYDEVEKMWLKRFLKLDEQGNFTTKKGN